MYIRTNREAEARVSKALASSAMGKEYNQDNYVICKNGRIGCELRSGEKRRRRCLYKRGAKGGEGGVSGIMKVEVVYMYD